MAAFKADEMDRVDYRLFQNSPVAMCYSPAIWSELLGELEALGYWCPRFNCENWMTEGEMHDDLAEKLDFPKYHGLNLDALNDFLSQLSADGKTGIVLVFHRYDHVVTRLKRVAWPVLDIIAHQSRYYLLSGERFFALVQSDNPRLNFDPIGGLAVQWNFREWLNSSRGV